MTNGEKKDERVRAEEKYKALVETAADAIFTLDLLGRLTFVNPAGERISGYSEEELVGKHFRELLPAKSIPACLNVFQKALRGQPTPPLEIEMITKQGQRVPLELLGRPVKRGRRVVEIIAIVRDITERKEAEWALRIRDSAIASSINAIALADLEGNLTYANSSFLKLWEYDDEKEVLGKPAVEFWQMEEKALEVVEALRDRGSWIGELVAKRKDGSLLDVQLSASMVTDEVGKPICMMASFIDITERKRAEEALSESEEKYRNIFETAPDGIVTVNLKGVITSCNSAFTNITGFPKSEIVGKHFSKLPTLRARDMPRYMKMFTSLIRGKAPKPFEARWLHRDGTTHWAEIRVSFMKEGPKTIGFQAIERDITERKQAEEALRESEEKYRTILESIEDGYYEVDLAGNLTFFNDALCRIFGYPEDELMGMNNRQYMDEETAKAVYQTFNAVYRTGKPASIFDHGIITKDGTKRSIQASVSLISGPAGEPVGFRGIIRDITERKRAEEEIHRRSKELAALYDVSLDMTAQLDLDTLLKTILLRAQGLLRANAGGLYLYDPERQDLELIVAQGLRKDYTGTRLALGEGACGKVAQSGEPLVVTDYAKWDGRSSHFADEPTFNVLAVPIKRGDTLLGALYVDDPDVERRFDDGDIRLATLFANQAAIAIENAQLFQESQRRAQEMAALRQVSLATLSTLERNQVFETMLDQLGTVIEYDTAAIKIITPDGRDKMIAGRGPVIYDQAMWNGFDAKDSKLVQEMKETRQTVVVHDAHADERYERVGDWEAFRSWVGAPLFVKDDLIGYLAVEKTSPGFYDENAVQLLGDFARAAAIALENARLFADTKSQLAQLTALQEPTGAVASTLELDKLLHLITQQATTLLQANGGIINLVDWEKKEDEVVAGSGSAAATLGYRSPLEGSLSGWATLHNQPVISNQLQNDSRADRRPRSWLVEGMKEQTQSVAIAPLTIKDQAIGTLVIMDKQGRKGEFDQTDLDLLAAFANQAATAIENARLYEETQKRLAETTVLHEVSEIINSTLDLKEVFQRVVEELSETFGYRLVDIYLLEGEALRLQANVGYDAQTTIELIPLERGVIGRVARAGQPAFIRDVTKDPDYIPAYAEIKSEICVPVKSGETLLGTLNVESDAKRPLTDDDLKLLVTLSSHIGVAIDNARLYQEVQARRVYLETLQRINATLRSTLPLREVLDTIVRAATEALGYVGSFIAIPDATGECLTLGAAWGGRIVDAALKVTRFKLESFSVPVKVQENLIARAFVSGELQAATGNPEAMAVGTEPSISGKMASAIERISGAKGTACVPLRVGEKSVGVLIIVSPREQLAADERAMLLGLADQAGLAIQNARLYEESQQLAITDGLTGLYNLRYFYEALEKEIQRSERYHRPVSLIILDIDNFKRYNDTHGHLAGDDLLKELAQLMSGVIRQADTLARYGGEEFAIILPETETEGARFLAERLQEEVREYRFSKQDGQAIGRITISLGVATHPHHADSAKALVHAADKALLRAKQAGKNRLSVCGEELIELKPR